jgi:hypothetical protein
MEENDTPYWDEQLDNFGLMRLFGSRGMITAGHLPET